MEHRIIQSRRQIVNSTYDLMCACHNSAWNAGWWHDINTGELAERNKGEMLALIHSEVSEALEALRKNAKDDKLTQYDGAPVELFDAAIRIFDLVGRYWPEQYTALADKLEYNASREDHKIENRRKADGKKF